MPETFEEYRTRILGYLGGGDPMRVLESTPARLKRLIRDVPRARLVHRAAPNKWSVTEILAHLADAELAIAWRFRSMLATPGVHLQWWDEHLWSEKLGYMRIPVSSSLVTFAALRRSNLALLRAAPRESWSCCYGIHDKRGRQTVAEFVTLEAAHDLNHLLQIRQLISGGKAKRGTAAGRNGT